MDGNFRALYRSMLHQAALMEHDPEQQEILARLVREAGGPDRPRDWNEIAEWARSELARLDREDHA